MPFKYFIIIEPIYKIAVICLIQTSAIAGDVMVTFGGLMRTMAVTKNPATAVISKVTKKRVEITFKNGNKLHLTWQQFTFFRDHYEIMRQYQVENADDASFRFKNKKI